MIRYVTESQPDGTMLSYFKSMPLTRTHLLQTLAIVIVLVLTLFGGGAAAVALADTLTVPAAIPYGNPEIRFDPDSKFIIVCESGAKMKIVIDDEATLYGFCKPAP